jgi:signal transduction histidine kinase/ligand-binding sensor domain-containing protein/DNA-binding response OmpR family regulator
MDTVERIFTKVTGTASDGMSCLTSAVNAVYQDQAGDIWIASMTQGIFRYNPERKKLTKIELSKYSLETNACWVIYGNQSGNIWIGTRSGLLRYNRDTDKLDPVESMFSASEGFPYEILSILEDKNGNLWLGSWGNGLYSYDKQSDSYVSYLNQNDDFQYVTHIRSIFQYDDKTLFIGSDDGLYRFDPETKKSERIDISHLQHSLSDQNVYSIYRDKENGIWIGTYFGGVNYLHPSQLNTDTYYPDRRPGTLSGKAVSQFCEDRYGNLWIATEDGGVNYFNAETKNISQPITTSYHNIHALLLDGDKLWIGTFSRGIDVYNTKTKSLINYRNNSKGKNTLRDNCIFSLYKTRQGDIYVGSSVGLNKYDKATDSFTHIESVTGFIYDIKEDHSGNVWLATYGTGVIKLDAATGKWIHYDDILNSENPIVNSKLTSVYIDSQRRIFFSSEGKGIFIYDAKKDDFANISEADGLPNNVVYGILDDPFGNLWISCNKGLVCFSLSDPHTLVLYNKEDGLQSNQFNYKSSYKARNGKFYFGGINGFSSFYPQDLNATKNIVIPPVEITGINLLGHSDTETENDIQIKLNKKQKIKLPYDKSSFTVSYVSLSYISQAKNRYAYKLEGTDTDYNYVENNKSVTYVNLPYGTYWFSVKATNNDDLWNETGTHIEIEISPPFWLSLPAKILYFIVLISLAYAALSYYWKKDKKKRIQQLDAFKAEQETLAFKSKIDFFTTIAHEIRTPLSLITAPLEEVINMDKGHTEMTQNLLIIEKNCSRLTVLINQLLDFRKMDSVHYVVNPESIQLKEFVYELYERFKKTAQRKQIDFILNLPQDKKKIRINSDVDALTKIIGNLLTNALKYTKDRIILSLACDDNNSYMITVEDNGRGISESHKSLIFDPFYQVQTEDRKIGTGLGLSLAKNLADVLDGRIDVADGKNGGTVFTFRFPDIEPSFLKAGSFPDQPVPPLPAETIQQAETNSRYCILVVEDNPDMVSFIKKCLQNDYIVDSALNATDALLLLEEKSCDIIISDIMMPGIDGISFTKKVKSDINYSHIPVILLSAKTENAVKIEGLLSGADVYIEKPFSTSYLKAQILSLIENRKAMLDAFNRSPLASYSNLVFNKNDELFLNKLNEEIEKYISEESFSVELLTGILNISRSNLQRKLKTISGVTPGDYLRNYRLKKACKLLLETDMRINEVAYSVGFSSPSYFAKVFQKSYNMLPKEFVNKYLNEDKEKGGDFLDAK